MRCEKLLILCMLIPPVLIAADSPTADQPAVLSPSTEIAVVDGEAISLRELEDELLQIEGAQQVQDMVQQQLLSMPWEHLDDDDIVVAMGAWQLPRIGLVATLLQQHGAQVREQLIVLTLVRQAMATRGMTFDDEMIADELAFSRRKFRQRLEAEGGPTITFDDYIKETQGMTVEEWTQESGFQMQAAIHAILYATAEVDEVALRDHFDRHRREYIIPPMAELSVLFVPFRGEDGQPPGEADKDVSRGWVQNLHQQLAKGRLTFDKLSVRFQEAGHIGWVRPDGSNPELGAKNVPEQVAEAALQTRPRPGKPELLPVIETPRGLTIAQVHAIKAGQRPAFADVRDQVRRDYIDANLDHYSQRFLNDLRREADIDYPTTPSFDAIKRQRREAAADFVQRRQAEIHAEHADTADSPSAR